MRLKQIRPFYFRAFGKSDWIDLNADLVVLFGPNGYGKTCLAESVEWLLYGKTKRRERGETLSQRDYQGSYRNVHAPTGVLTCVEAEFRLHDGTEHVLRRELVLGPRNAETSRTFVDGHPSDFAAVGFDGNELYYPVIAQDNLQELIHSKPKERRDRLGAALGLETLVRFKTVADKARTRFQSDPPPVVVEAKQQMQIIVRAMNQSEKTKPIALRWTSDKFDLVMDAKTLHEIAAQVLGGQAPADWQEVLDGLSQRRVAMERRVFDDTSIRPRVDLDDAVQFVESECAGMRSLIGAVQLNLAEFLAATASVYSQALLSWWATGLELVDPGSPSTCPMCQSGTLSQARQSEITQAIADSKAYNEAWSGLKQASEKLVDAVTLLAGHAKSLHASFLRIEQRDAMVSLFDTDPSGYTEFLFAHDATRCMLSHVEQCYGRLASELARLPSLASDPRTVARVTSMAVALPEILEATTACATTSARQYVDSYTAFAYRLRDRISDTSAIKDLDALLAPMRGWASVTVAREYKVLLDESLEVVREIETNLQSTQVSMFVTRGKEIDHWYSLLNPGAPVRFSRMEVGTDSLQLWAETYGVEMNAIACLSQCQLNCLGLSVHLMRSLTKASPFSFILMDDPVQAMDDTHCQSLVTDMVNELITKEQRQLIVCSHVQGLVDDIWETYYHRQPLRLRICDFQVTGPEIVSGETLQQCVARAEQFAKGNEDNRRLAVKVVRRSTELLVREVCRKARTSSPPRVATASQMLPWFQNCPGTTPAQASGLRMTIKFSDPAPHSQVGWSVPTTPEILPHTDRLRETARALGVW